MDTHKLFKNFNSTIVLASSKISKLQSNRKALREKIRNHFSEKKWGMPKFYSQGSFPLGTNLNPIKKTASDGSVKEEYDLDDGVYFICLESDRKEPSTYHDRIKKAVDGHAESVIDKTTCVRVVYADGHHIDLPSYWLEKDGNVPQLAHKSKDFINSDPKAFKDWVDDKISATNHSGQLRRIIRYLKAWKDYRENQNSSLKLLSGFILTILACNHFSENGRDDLAIKETVEAIKRRLNTNFACYRPTVPTNEDLLESFSKNVVIKELESFIDNAQKAIDSDCKKTASEHWRKLFGDRFPLGKEEEKSATHSSNADSIRTKVSPLWLSY